MFSCCEFVLSSSSHFRKVTHGRVCADRSVNRIITNVVPFYVLIVPPRTPNVIHHQQMRLHRHQVDVYHSTQTCCASLHTHTQGNCADLSKTPTYTRAWHKMTFVKRRKRRYTSVLRLIDTHRSTKEREMIVLVPRQCLSPFPRSPSRFLASFPFDRLSRNKNDVKHDCAHLNVVLS